MAFFPLYRNCLTGADILMDNSQRGSQRLRRFCKIGHEASRCQGKPVCHGDQLTPSRSVAFPGFSESLKGGYNAGTAQVFGELAYGFNFGTTRFEPFANLAYVNLHTDGFRETGGAAALTSGSSSTDTTFTTLGLRGSTTFDLNGASVTAKGMLGWRHAFDDVTPTSRMGFADGGSAFTVAGVPVARNAAVVEAGLDFALTPSAVLGVTYGGQFGSGVVDQSFKANFSAKF